MILANNALYSANGEAVRFNGGCSGIFVEGNVTYGPVVGCSTGWAPGSGLDDFERASWDGSLHTIVPAPGSQLLNQADPGWVTPADWTGMGRGAFPSAGAAEPGAYGTVLGPGLAGQSGLVPRLSASAKPVAGDAGLQLRLEQARPNRLRRCNRHCSACRSALRREKHASFN